MSVPPPASPSVSVVMGVFNGARWLPETLDSLQAQTDGDWELIVVDDGSTEPRVGELLAERAAQDPRIRVIAKSHEGLTRALMDGCAVARGAYIARIDAGDTMTPDRLRRQRAVLDRHPGVGFVSCRTEFCGPEWEPLYVRQGRGTPEEGADVLPVRPGDNLADGPTSHVSVLFRKELYDAVGGYRPEFYYGQDWDLWYRLAERSRFAMVPEVLARVRLFPESLSAGARERQEEIGRCSLGSFWARREGRPETEWLARAAAIRPVPGVPAPRKTGQGDYFIGELLRRNGDPRCRRYFRDALRSNPLHPQAAFRLLQSFLPGGLR
jgi:glycosyltransferase involved in cell wall biosynthesis